MKPHRIVALRWFAVVVLAATIPGAGGDVAAQAAPAGLPQAPDHLIVSSVTASGSDGNVPENAVDGDPSTRWSALTEAPAPPPWLELDLGSAQPVGYLGIAWHQGDRRPSLFDVETSLDGESWTVAVEGGVSSGTTLNFEPVELGVAVAVGLHARFIRYIGHGNTLSGWNSLTEVRAYPAHPGGAVVDDLSALLPAPSPDAVAWTEPGLVGPDGDQFVITDPAAMTGRSIDVLDFGADPAPSTGDDAAALRAAIAAAEPGDEVVLPAGTFDLMTTEAADSSTNIALRSGVHLRGAGAAVTILRSSLTPQTSSGKVLRGYGIRDVVVANLTVSSTYDGPFSTDSRDDDAGGGPAYGIYLAHLGARSSERVLVQGVTVERFQRIGVRIEKSREVVVRDSHFRDATSVGGGGSGYGIAIQGAPGQDRFAYEDDSRHNAVVGNTFDGTHLRHAILLQYFTHNNLVSGNSITGVVLDAIDLHGEDEYLNEIRSNAVTGGQAAGIALGNTGGSATQHDAAGPGNWLHDNVLSGNREGIIVMLGTPDTLIERNVITGSQAAPARAGIELRNAPGTVVRNNVISGNRADGFWGIHLLFDEGDEGHASGVPTDVLLERNVVAGNSGGLRIDAGERVRLIDNTVRGNGEDVRISGDADVVRP
ncbi:right-handed parallel beta-helix repeat-containing protein [Pengzhenrongella frigida]|uniref:F5/8 type C domain-containing protein n=1 Tax=Pengzhenrongella frigida TaxID=1259133 RepID=A0A4Q5N5J6_9MICO|nr:right-handed parallel beta-helix repeat-containing protein [Cellulomonas sp. HLT2-17]RYV52117.1 hypothetical protein EUA98_04965 [Cellulomonas sp. HLT2-17]